MADARNHILFFVCWLSGRSWKQGRVVLGEDFQVAWLERGRKEQREEGRKEQREEGRKEQREGENRGRKGGRNRGRKGLGHDEYKTHRNSTHSTETVNGIEPGSV